MDSVYHFVLIIYIIHQVIFIFVKILVTDIDNKLALIHHNIYAQILVIILIKNLHT